MKKLLLFIIALLIIVSAVSAERDFDVTVTAVDDRIYRNESAQFKVSITNNRAFDSKMTFSAPDAIAFWDISAVPLTDYPLVFVPADQSRDVLLKFRPISSLMMPGTKRLVLKVTSDKGASIESDIMILVLSEDIRFGKYYPRVLVEGMEVPALINPKQEYLFYFFVENMNSLNLSDVVLQLDGNVVNKTEHHFAIGPYGKKTLEVRPNINPFATPGKNSISIKMIANEEIIKEYKKDVEVEEVFLPYDYKENIQKSFLKAWFNYTVHNPANVPQPEPVKIETGYIDRLFSSTKPKATIYKEGGHFYSWPALQPGETINVVIVRSHRSLLYIAIALVVLLIIYYYFKPDLVIKKEAIRVVVKEGGLSDSLIRLNIKNVSGVKLENVRVVETIPNIAEYVKEDKLGVIPPTSIRQFDISGTKLEWVFDELGPREERILTFKMVSKLKVLGKFRLKATEASFMKKGKKKTCYSNTLTLIQG
ncbi:hypothetical protein KY311_01530 [Candidatus Woesearchaeota archaeon]|nr:hypothetical protein [Candidatus Woesearchaeota archaeon]